MSMPPDAPKPWVSLRHTLSFLALLAILIVTLFLLPREKDGLFSGEIVNGKLVIKDRETYATIPLQDCKGDSCQVFSAENRIIALGNIQLAKKKELLVIESEKKVGSVTCCLSAVEPGATVRTIVDGVVIAESGFSQQSCCTFDLPDWDRCRRAGHRWVSDQFRDLYREAYKKVHGQPPEPSPNGCY